MSEFTVQSESIDVERIMSKIRQRISENRDEGYTEEQIRELAKVTLEGFLDPQNIRADMADRYRKRLREKETVLRESMEMPAPFEFDADSIYRSSRGFTGRVLYRTRKLLSPLLKLFFNPAPIVHALTVQHEINQVISQMARTHTEFIEIAALNYEVMNKLVVEMTRLSIEMKNHQMRVESVASRLDFDDRRTRSLERVVQPRASAPPSSSGRAVANNGAPQSADDSGSPERKRRRRRRGRRRPTGADSAAPREASESGAGNDRSSAAPASATEETASPASDNPSGPAASDAAPTAAAASGPMPPDERAGAPRESPGTVTSEPGPGGQPSVDDREPSER